MRPTPIVEIPVSLHKFRVRIAAALALLIAGAALVDVVHADVEQASYSDLSWRLIGPFRGGRVLAVAGVPREPQHFYFGAVNGGVWETIDAGRTWQPIFDQQSVGSIGAIAVAPSAPNVVYVGTGEADMRSDIAQGTGMYRSRDGGHSWTRIGLDDSQQIGKIIIDPADPNAVFVAALGHPYGPNKERGVFRTRDGGETWQRVLGSDEATGAIDLAFEPGNAKTIYAAMWQARRTPWNIYPPASGPGSGLYKSTDGGDTWTPMRANGFPERVGRIGVAVAPSNPQRVYAIVDSLAVEDDIGGLYRSDDAGASWKRISRDDRIWQRGWYFNRIAVDPKNADRVYVMNTIVLRTDDGGEHFIALKGDHTGDDFHEMWIDPENPDRQILGVDQGAIVTLNGGKTWSSWLNQPTAQIYHVSTDNRFPYRVYGAQQDSGAAEVPSRTGDHDGITMREFREVTVGGESDMIAPDPDDPDTVFGGRVDKLDLRTGQTQSVDPTLPSPDLYRHTWTLPLVFSQARAEAALLRQPEDLPHQRRRRALGRDQPRSHARGSRRAAERRCGHRGESSARRVRAAASSTRSRRRRSKRISLWAGTDDGLIWTSNDDGAHWDNVTPAELTAWSKVGTIDASHFDKGTAYAAIDRHRLDDRKPYIYRTHDGGKTLAARRRPASATATSSTRCARIPRRRDCSTPRPSSACTSRSTTATTGIRCRRTCRARRCATSTCTVTISSSPRTAAASGSWTTHRCCVSSTRARRISRRVSTSRPTRSARASRRSPARRRRRTSRSRAIRRRAPQSTMCSART